jgi:hypothetical protein
MGKLDLDGLVGHDSHDHRANDPQRLSPAAATLPTALAAWLALDGSTTRGFERPSARERPMCQHPEFFRPFASPLERGTAHGPRPTRSLAQPHSRTSRIARASFLFFCFFLLFFRKILSNMHLAERFQKMDPLLGAIVLGAKI